MPSTRSGQTAVQLAISAGSRSRIRRSTSCPTRTSFSSVSASCTSASISVSREARTTDLTRGIESGIHRELAQPEPDENPGQHRVGGHVAADRERDAGGDGRVDDRLEEPQHGGVQRLIEVRDVVVVAIGGESILNEIVGPEAEEGAVPGQVIRGQRGAGRLDHDAEGDRRFAADLAPPSEAGGHVVAIAKARSSSVTPETSGSISRIGAWVAAR